MCFLNVVSRVKQVVVRFQLTIVVVYGFLEVASGRSGGGCFIGIGRGDQGIETLFRMTRGSQRDRDRERAAARTAAKGKGKEDGLTPEQRRERDAKALQEKLAKKSAQPEGGSSSNTKSTKK
ncbi:hypothetical protein R1sor_010938 [Riccia sorocarpa]|uniref:Small EDRK-rich factor-like N-terminal domain-containing protein n=1 Tax=Riccia sorocarpa TaxID=122646 RepID=A0ABD3I263_9MARC